MRLKTAPTLTGATLSRSDCGVRSGVTLTAVTMTGDDFFLDSTWAAANPHLIFEAKNVAGSLHVRTSGVVIRDCYVRDRILNYNGADVYPFRAEYCHIGSNSDLSANTTVHRADEGVGRTFFDLYRCVVEGSSDAVRANRDNHIIECWLDCVPVDALDHPDCIQTDGGAGFLNVQRCHMIARGPSGDFGNACYQQSNNPTTTVRFLDCYFENGGWQLRFDDDGSTEVRRCVFNVATAGFGPVTALVGADILWPVTGPDKNITTAGATVAAP